MSPPRMHIVIFAERVVSTDIPSPKNLLQKKIRPFYVTQQNVENFSLAFFPCMELEGKGWMKEKNLILMQQGSISGRAP